MRRLEDLVKLSLCVDQPPIDCLDLVACLEDALSRCAFLDVCDDQSVKKGNIVLAMNKLNKLTCRSAGFLVVHSLQGVFGRSGFGTFGKLDVVVVDYAAAGMMRLISKVAAFIVY